MIVGKTNFVLFVESSSAYYFQFNITIIKYVITHTHKYYQLFLLWLAVFCQLTLYSAVFVQYNKISSIELLLGAWNVMVVLV